jgi:endonuclease/exonuclease/phosphatase family metal-dependent hydrolase
MLRVAILLALQACAWTAAPEGSVDDRDAQVRECPRPDASRSQHADDASLPTGASGEAPQPTQLEPLIVMTWNLHWFLHPSEGPTDDAEQYRAVHAVIAGSGSSLVALQEVASETAFDRLLADSPDYAGLLSGHDWIQRTALLWLRDDFELISARPVSGLDDAGRPPLEVALRSRADGTRWTIIVLHAKAQADAASHATRTRFADGLSLHLRRQTPLQRHIVLGDFNDMLQGSITDGASTPYGPFIDDTERFATPTRVLNAAQADERSHAWGATVDHIVLSADLGPRVTAGSVDVLREELLPRYPRFIETVSDHFPVVLMLER